MNLLNGNHDSQLSANQLSAGEKQILSFWVYNGFCKHGIIFIDEPELSLHPDWQRKLVPTLMKQNTGNQLFMATHSAAIASYYPEKEIWLDAQNKKGGAENAQIFMGKPKLVTELRDLSPPRSGFGPRAPDNCRMRKTRASIPIPIWQ